MFAAHLGGVTSKNDPWYSNVTLLLHCNGTNGSTTFTDNSSSPKTITAYGNAQISTTSPILGSGSALFDGSGDYLSSASLTATTTYIDTTQDYTIEGRIKFNNAGTYQPVIIINGGSNAQGGISAWIANNSSLQFWNSGSLERFCNKPVLAGVTYNFAIVRNGTVIKCYVDGIYIGETATTTNNGASNKINIGGVVAGDTWDDSRHYYGRIDEIRITKGIARYLTNFTPETTEYPNS